MMRDYKRSGGVHRPRAIKKINFITYKKEYFMDKEIACIEKITYLCKDMRIVEEIRRFDFSERTSNFYDDIKECDLEIAPSIELRLEAVGCDGEWLTTLFTQYSRAKHDYHSGKTPGDTMDNFKDKFFAETYLNLKYDRILGETEKYVETGEGKKLRKVMPGECLDKEKDGSWKYTYTITKDTTYITDTIRIIGWGYPQREADELPIWKYSWELLVDVEWHWQDYAYSYCFTSAVTDGSLEAKSSIMKKVYDYMVHMGINSVTTEYTEEEYHKKLREETYF